MPLSPIALFPSRKTFTLFRSLTAKRGLWLCVCCALLASVYSIKWVMEWEEGGRKKSRLLQYATLVVPTAKVVTVVVGSEGRGRHLEMASEMEDYISG